MKKSAIILAAIMLLSSFEPVVATEKSTTENKKINWLLENDFVAGRGQTKDLKLDDTITRAEFTRMILVIKGEENIAKEDSTSKADFKDVPNTHWAEKFIVYAKQKGYISGYPDGNFRPEGEITYEEMISILARIHPNYRKIEAKSTNWAEGFINFAKDNGILDDINIKGSYKSPAIREKTFEMTYNFIKFVENQTKSEKVSKIKEEKDVKNENSAWNGFYPYWLGYGFRPIEEKKPDVKPAPEKPDKPEKENPGAETPPEPGTEPENPTEPGKENPSDPGTEPESPSEPETPKEFDKTKIDKIEIVSQPSKREYTEGEKLDLTGIKLKLTDTQGKDKGIGLEHFNEYGIATDPANETGLSVNENGTTIKIKLNGVEKVETAPLKVNAKVFDPAHVEKMGVKTQPTNLIYTEGEKLNLSGLEVTLTDNQGLTKDVAFADFATCGITAEPANETALTLANNEKKVTLTKGNLTAETEALTVKAKVFDPDHVEKMVVKEQPTNLIYTEGEKLNLAGLEVTLTDNQGLTKDVAFKDFGTNGITAEPANDTALTVAANNGKAVELTKGSLTAQTNTLTVNAKVFDPDYVEKMVVKTQPTNLTYTEGEKLNLSGLEVTLTDNQGLTKDVAFKDFGTIEITAEPANETALTLANSGKKVTLTKGSLTAETNALTVKAKEFDPAHVEKMVVKTQPTKLVYTEGEKLALAGLEVTLTDNQGLTKNVAFKDFATYGITAEPTNDTELKLADNGSKVKLTKGNLTAETKALTVLEKVVGPKDPTKPDGKNPDANKYWTVKFESADTSKGTVAVENTFYILKTAGKTLADLKGSAPAVTAIGNNKFDGWDPALDTNTAIDQDRTIKAQFSAKVFDPAHVEKMVVKTQPTNLTYTEGYKLDLTGLEVTLTDNQGLTKNVAFKDFAANGITTEPTNDTELKLADNGSKVKLTKGNLTAETKALTVLEKVVGPKDPTKPDGKNPDANKYWTVKFESADTSKGTVAVENTFYILKTAGKTLADLKGSAPAVTAIGNNKFDGWDPALDTNTAIDQDRTIKAQFSAKVFDPEHVENIEVKTQPTKLVYTDGEKLNLAGLEVTLIDNQGLTKDVVLSEFEVNDITVMPSNGQELNKTDNGNPVTIIKGNVTAKTNKLKVNPKEFDIENIVRIIIVDQPEKRDYKKGEKLSTLGLRIGLENRKGALKKGGFYELRYDYDIEIIPSLDEQLDIQHHEKPIIVKLGKLQCKTKPIFINIKVKFTDLDKIYFERTILIGAKVNKPEDPKKEGYKFAGWYKDPEFKTTFDFGSNLYDNMSIYAKWEKIN